MAPKKRIPEKFYVKPLNPWWKGDLVKYELPYFADEQMDPAIYTMSIGKPMIGAFELQIDVKQDSVGDYDSDEIDSSGEAMSRTRGSTAEKGKNFTLDRKDKHSAKRLKISGGHAATAKKVSWDMDSDDELIVTMKEAGRTEREIAERLAAEGRIRYNPKTIGTRWSRLKKAIQDRQDELMDAELTDWHDGDDEVLAQAIVKAEKHIETQKQKLEERKWKFVADTLKNLKPVTNFSQRACRERAEALATNTAKPCPEHFESPTEEIRQRVQSRLDKEKKFLDNGGSMRKIKQGFVTSRNGEGSSFLRENTDTPQGTPSPTRNLRSSTTQSVSQSLTIEKNGSHTMANDGVNSFAGDANKVTNHVVASGRDIDNFEFAGETLMQLDEEDLMYALGYDSDEDGLEDTDFTPGNA